MMSKVYKLAIVFFVGIMGGVFADQIFWPYFIERPLFYRYRLDQAPVYINKTDQIYIQESVALENAAEKVEKSIAGIITESGKRSSGVVITSDGLVLTLNSAIPAGTEFDIFIDSKKSEFEVIRRDKENNLALIKIKSSNIATVGFVDTGSLRFGQRIFLSGSLAEQNGLVRIINEGIIKTYNEKEIQTNIIENNPVNGSPVFNIKGELVGLAVADKNGAISLIPVNIIKNFVGF